MKVNATSYYLALAVLGAGCGGAAEEPDISIGALRQLPVISVAHVREFQDTNSAFYRVRGAALADRVAVVWEADRIRILDLSSGEHAVIGARGDGPGEYREIRWASLARDSIWIHDHARQVQVFDLSGRFARAFKPAPVGGERPRSVTPIHVGTSGLLATVPRAVSDRTSTDPLVLMDFSGSTRIVAEFPVVDSEMISLGSFGPAPAPFAAQRRIADGGESTYVVTDTQVRRLADDGSVTWTRTLGSAAVESDDFDGFVSAFVSEVRDPAAQAALANAWRAEAPGTDLRPLFGGIGPWNWALVDASERLWVREYLPARGSWIVINRNGIAEERVEFEPSKVPLAVRGDQVLLAWRDAMLVEHLELARLIR